MFKTSKAMQKHLDVDEHCFRLQKDSAYDSVKGKWAAACTSYVSSDDNLEELSQADHPPLNLVKLNLCRKERQLDDFQNM